MFLRRRENRSTWRKHSRSKDEKQQPQPTYDVESGNLLPAPPDGVIRLQCGRFHMPSYGDSESVLVVSSHILFSLWGRDMQKNFGIFCLNGLNLKF